MRDTGFGLGLSRRRSAGRGGHTDCNEQTKENKTTHLAPHDTRSERLGHGVDLHRGRLLCLGFGLHGCRQRRVCSIQRLLPLISGIFSLGAANVNEAEAQLRHRRPRIRLNAAQRRALE
ncbi:hypothetical protein WMF45_45090 [Sorangium sp. So ce448]|uniref:hypothetical protein n=1 Tax=Sorangium sp. So ce448 TaxID=3133314 RepID=UPI003F61CF23